MHTPALAAALDAYFTARVAYFAALDCGLPDDDDTDNARDLRATFQTALDAARDCGLSPLATVSVIVRRIHNERE